MVKFKYSGIYQIVNFFTKKKNVIAVKWITKFVLCDNGYVSCDYYFKYFNFVYCT